MKTLVSSAMQPILSYGSRKDLRLGGRQYATGGYLLDGTPVAVMGRSNNNGIDHEGYIVEYVGLGSKDGPHPFETSGVYYNSSVWRRVRHATEEELSAQEAEHAGLDPKVYIPTETYYVFGSGSYSVKVQGELPNKPIEDGGHNGFWGDKGITCRLSEIPADTSVTTKSYPGGTRVIVKKKLAMRASLPDLRMPRGKLPMPGVLTSPND